MDINKMTIGEIKEIQGIFSVNSNNEKHPYKVGKNYFVRTVTMSILGKLEAVYKKELVFSGACWVADSGRFGDCLKNGIEKTENSEYEMFDNDVFVNRDSLIDITEYRPSLPTASK